LAQTKTNLGPAQNQTAKAFRQRLPSPAQEMVNPARRKNGISFTLSLTLGLNWQYFYETAAAGKFGAKRMLMGWVRVPGQLVEKNALSRQLGVN
jgi:hypothetical protein